MAWQFWLNWRSLAIPAPLIDLCQCCRCKLDQACLRVGHVHQKGSRCHVLTVMRGQVRNETNVAKPLGILGQSSDDILLQPEAQILAPFRAQATIWLFNAYFILSLSTCNNCNVIAAALTNHPLLQWLQMCVSTLWAWLVLTDLILMGKKNIAYCVPAHLTSKKKASL